MARDSVNHPTATKQRIDASLTARAKKMNARIPNVGIGVPEQVSQAEIVNVLRIRAQLSEMKEELLRAQGLILDKLEGGAEEQYGFYSCNVEHMQLHIWESDSLLEL